MTRGILFFLIFWIMLPFGAIYGSERQALNSDQEQNIVETVTVENIETTVRVFKNGASVKGLSKENFQLVINEQAREINGFFEEIKTLNASDHAGYESAGASAKERLFVLLFNLSDYHQDMKSILDYLFTRLIRRGDRVIVITNRYFLPEWKVSDVTAIRLRLEEILTKEVNAIKMNMMQYHSELKAQAASLLSRLQDPAEASSGDFPAGIFKDFFLNYQFVLEDISRQFLALPLEQYIKISGYLSSQRMEKWVFSFYQLGQLPILDKMGRVNQELKYIIDGGAASGSASGSAGPGLSQARNIDYAAASRSIQSLYFEFIMNIQNSEKQLVEDISKMFLNSGATFHTLLMKPVSPSFSEDYKSETVYTETEEIFKRLSALTGGSIVLSNRAEDLDASVAKKEDVVYSLTYAPLPSDRKKKMTLEIRVTPGDYSVVYDDRRRQKAFESAMKGVSEGVYRLEIDSVRCDGRFLLMKLKNIQIMNYESDRFGAVQTKVKILDKKSQVVSLFERIFKGVREEGVIRTPLPDLAPGKYHVVVEIRDLFSLDGVYAGDAITFTRGKN